MKKYEYRVTYLNDKDMIFYCSSFQEAVVRGMNFAYDKGRDCRIKYIESEEGLTIKDIEVKFNYTK